MGQYDIEWKEIEEKTKILVTKEIDPFVQQSLANTKLLEQAVNDIRNQEEIIEELRNAVFIKNVKDVVAQEVQE